jgi:O-antigen ligase
MSKKNVKNSNGLKAESQTDLFIQLLIVVIIATLTTFPFIFDSFTVSKILILAVGLTYVSIRFLGTIRLVTYRKLPVFLSFMIAFFVLTMFFSWWSSDVPLLRGLFGQFGRGNGLFYYLFVILVFVFAIKTFKSTSASKMHQYITWLSWFMVSYATLQRIGIDIAKLETRDLSPVVLTFGNSNFAGAMLSVLFAYHFTYSILKKSIGVYQTALLLALITTTTFTAAVQGYLIIVFAIFLGASIHITQRLRSIWVLRGVLAVWGLGSIAILLGVFGKFIFAGIFSRSTFQARIEYWKVTLNIIQDFPLFGIGPDKLFDVTANYMSPGSLKLITSTRMDNAHNWFLNLGVNYGLMALLFLSLILGYVFYRMVFLFRNLSNSNPIPVAASVGFAAMFIDGLVSLEQPGLGIWMYILGGVTVGSTFEVASLRKNGESSNSKNLTKALSVCSIITLSISSFLLVNRVVFDGILRSNIQTALLNQGTQKTFSNIESASIRLKSEPEYSVQALKPLAAIGDGAKLDLISQASYEYYLKSIQATLIRADVLRALNREVESCPLRSTLIRNTPWDFSQTEKYVLCLVNGYMDKNMVENLKLTQKFWEPLDTTRTPNEFNELMRTIHLAAIRANISRLLDNLDEAAALRTYANKLIAGIESVDPQALSESQREELGKYKRLLTF